jgi:hypothetical protein
MSRIHNYKNHSTRKTHASSGPGSNPSVSLVRRQRRKLKENNLLGELRNIKSLNFIGEHRKGEEVKAWLLEMKKYF